MKKLLLFLLFFSSPMYILYYKIGGQPFTLFRVVFIISSIYIMITTALTFKINLPIKKSIIFFITIIIGLYYASWIQVDNSSILHYGTSKMISICVFFLTVYIISFLINSKELLFFSLKSIVFSCLVVCLFNIINYFTIINYNFNLIDLTDAKMDSHNFMSTFSDDGVRLPGTFFDTNVFAIYIISAIIILIYFIFW